MFIKPGKHNYAVGDLRAKGKEFVSCHQVVVDPTFEEPIPNQRITKVRTADLFFKHKTVFAPWPDEDARLFR